MKNLGLVFAIATMVSLCACTNDDEPNFPGKRLDPITSLKFEGEQAEANRALNEFSFKFFNAAAASRDEETEGKPATSVSASPLSASLLLAMLANSSDDISRDEIIRSLGYSDLDVVNDVCNQLMRYLPNNASGNEVRLSNSVWYDKGQFICPVYAKKMEDTFGASVQPVDFSTDQAGKEINAWADKITDGMINNIMPENPLPYTIFLSNALYFNCNWKFPFNKDLTSKQKFYGTAGAKMVDMMNSHGDMQYAVDDKFQMVCLPFVGNSQMMLLLPNEDIDPREAAQALTYDEWISLKSKDVSKEVILKLPKFKVNSELQLKDPLAALGINLETLNLSPTGIDTGYSLSAFQVSATEISENGAKVAAVTGADATVDSDSNRIVKLTFDRPFIYVIENTSTGSIIIAGRVANI